MKKLIAIVLCFLSFHAMAQLKPFEAGEYIKEADSGVLRMGPFENGYQSFEIEANTGFYSCNLSGKIYRHVGVTDGGDCEIVLYRTDSGIEVAMDDEMFLACDNYCDSMGAFFIGQYLKSLGEGSRE